MSAYPAWSFEYWCRSRVRHVPPAVGTVVPGTPEMRTILCPNTGSTTDSRYAGFDSAGTACGTVSGTSEHVPDVQTFAEHDSPAPHAPHVSVPPHPSAMVP